MALLIKRSVDGLFPAASETTRYIAARAMIENEPEALISLLEGDSKSLEGTTDTLQFLDTLQVTVTDPSSQEEQGGKSTG